MLATDTFEGFLPSPVYELMIASPGDHQFEAALDLARDQYRAHFGCQLSHFYPKVFCLYKDGVLVACCGFRSASDEDLFLEQYLDAPVEVSLNAVSGTQTKRSSIVEIGGLAVLNRDEAFMLMVRLAPEFRALGFTHGTCTVTRPVRRCLNKLGIESHFLADADRDRVSDADDWGRYYDMSPCVLVGEIQPAIDRMAPFMSLLSPSSH